MASPLPLTLRLTTQRFPYKQPFRISGHVFGHTSVLLAELSDGRHIGRGEGAGVYYLGDDIAHMAEAAEGARIAIKRGAQRKDLQTILPPGGARNAIDCAFWDLEAKQQGTPVWQLAGLRQPRPLLSTLTLGADAPDVMAKAAASLDPLAPIKLKLTGEAELDAARLAAVRAARPDAWIGVDANQGYDSHSLPGLLLVLEDNGIALLEQPLPRGNESDLAGLSRPLPFAADESALCLADTDALCGLFDIVNIKLDKCGGLTEGLAIAKRARALGLGVMVGNMMGSSLSMAPSYLLGQLCDVVDLDGPTFLAQDRTPSVVYAQGRIHCADEIWGNPD
ncbi:dipeptide epimerase [Altericroceibacterium endophyticum]|uniref:Dipeptide epimerase n=1 Tax=Altericroceibacterium endophyticum TaxID=1808508 RepID=A0A6I4TA39_9SPHN|nr:dipeptide epimerase [Altericroceibacterium endophyticum]MXO66740.1 dipeptide epimerase [Altericroceibacterium endophyticum]